MIFLALLLQAASPAPATPPPSADEKLRRLLPPGYPLPQRSHKVTGPVEQVLLSPVFDRIYSCVEHPFGSLGFLGDDLGTDCLVQGGITREGGYLRNFKTDGKRNDDWYGWHADVLAPLDGTIDFIWINPVDNTPGTFGKPPASEITIRGDNGVMISLAHIVDPTVKKGDHVTAGQKIAKVGNNGVARAPHTHIGAYRISDKTPLQIRWDQRAIAKIIGEE